MELYWYFLLAAIAFLYASVGHGGASGYLALMALMGIETLAMRTTALTLNLFVSMAAFLMYYQKEYFRARLLLPFALSSVPMAYLGARLHVDPTIYKIMLGIALLIATARMLISPKQGKSVVPFSFTLALFVGAALGFFSGMIGIGGGIILTPFLIIIGWANLKEAAAVSALFIFLNSLSGLAGIMNSGYQLIPGFYGWIIIGTGAGLAGSWWGSGKLSVTSLRYVLSAILIMASYKLFIF
ncbi:MAG: sulfite exporter TauE/SafE family protein [Candidatus Saccharibacteria bacterium]